MIVVFCHEGFVNLSLSHLIPCYVRHYVPSLLCMAHLAIVLRLTFTHLVILEENSVLSITFLGLLLLLSCSCIGGEAIAFSLSVSSYCCKSLLIIIVIVTLNGCLKSTEKETEMQPFYLGYWGFNICCKGLQIKTSSLTTLQQNLPTQN